MSSADEGGDPPCWAHLLDEPDVAVSSATERRTHPKLAAALLMVGVVVLLLVLSYASIVW
jgi:hypothetical protein